MNFISLYYILNRKLKYKPPDNKFDNSLKKISKYTNKPRIFFISFGGPLENYHNAVKRICNEAKPFNIFDEIIQVTDIDLKNDANFWNQHKNFIENNKRGYGYWTWKPYIILKLLNNINDNDIIIYADAGCTLNINGKKRLLDYIDIVSNSKYGMLTFQTNFKNIEYTKKDTIDYVYKENNNNSNMLIATVLILKKCKHSQNIINEWYRICSNHYNLLDDSPSIQKNFDNFIEHRHDQSIFSLLCLKYKTESLDDETYPPNIKENPIWASRKIN